MLFMSFSTVPAVQPWTCHREDRHFTQHLTEEEEEQKKGRGKERVEERSIIRET